MNDITQPSTERKDLINISNPYTDNLINIGLSKTEEENVWNKINQFYQTQSKEDLDMFNHYKNNNDYRKKMIESFSQFIFFINIAWASVNKQMVNNSINYQIILSGEVHKALFDHYLLLVLKMNIIDQLINDNEQHILDILNNQKVTLNNDYKQSLKQLHKILAQYKKDYLFIYNNKFLFI